MTSPPRCFTGMLGTACRVPPGQVLDLDDELVSMDSRTELSRQSLVSRQPLNVIPRYPPGFIDGPQQQGRPRRRLVEHSPAQSSVQASARQSPEEPAGHPKIRREPEQQEEARALPPVHEMPEVMEPIYQNVRQPQIPNLRVMRG